MKSHRGWHLKRALKRLAAASAALAAVGASSPAAHADDSAYCRKVHTRAASDAALLIGPTLRLEGIRLPTQQGATVDPTLGTPVQAGSNNDYQLRASATVSPLSMYRGFEVMGIGDADCSQHGVLATAQDILTQDKDYGRLPALKREIAYLDEHRAAWEAIQLVSEQRFAANVTTLQQVEDIRTRTVAFERRRAQLGAEVSRLESLGAKVHTGSIDELARAVDATAMAYEKRVSHVRSLDTWDLRITGGYIPPILGSEKSDVFGAIQLTYNVGGAWRNSNEARYLEARNDELKTSASEVSSRLAAFREGIRGTVTRSKRELEILEGRIAVLNTSRDALLAASDAMKAAHALALIDLELMAAESDKAFLTELVGQLSHS